MMRALLVSTYELGRQPFGLASPAAWLRREGWVVECRDAAKERLDDQSFIAADLIGVHLPMHTATRLAGPLILRARRVNKRARLCAYGLYAPPNAEWLQSLGVDEVLGGEYEADLAAIGRRLTADTPPGEVGPDTGGQTPARVPRLEFLVPDRSTLLPLGRYATLQMPDGSRRQVGATDASRGCKHRCRHCPVVPIYQGQFRIVAPEIVLADIAAQVAAGAEHITFGDPDFFNGPRHAMRVVEALHAAHPRVSYDVTIKVEHLLRHRTLVPQLAATGCAFVTSAVESIDDRVLTILQKGHTRADLFEAVEVCRTAGVAFSPTFVAFHPWLELDDYCELLDIIAALDLVDRVAPIQLTIRLLVPRGSLLVDRVELRDYLEPFDPMTLAYPWTHPDRQVDRLQRDVASLVGTAVGANRRAVFNQIRALAYERAGRGRPRPVDESASAAAPLIDEPWYCCAEPNPHDLRMI